MTGRAGASTDAAAGPDLASRLVLPCGAILANRLCKAAMSEGLADAQNRSNARLETLYRTWGHSGAALLLSGNIQVDRAHLERPGNIVFDSEDCLPGATALALAGRAGGRHFWAQLSHTGRQVSSFINPAPLAPSSVELDVIRNAGFSFARPRAMTEADIEDAIEQFVRAGRLAKQAGFTGVQLHAAHGYLLSQFLSPHSNVRDDRWGGSIANRARILIETCRRLRAAVGAAYPIGVKLNASDFLKGAFSHDDCLEVVRLLNGVDIDLLEISGGNLEQPKLAGVSMKEEGQDGMRASTRRREAYFIEFAQSVRATAAMPVMVTGGFRTRALMREALANGELDLVGIGRPFLCDPSIADKLLRGEVEDAPAPERSRSLMQSVPWFNMQIERLADGLAPDMSLDGDEATSAFVGIETARMQAFLAGRAEQPRAA